MSRSQLPMFLVAVLLGALAVLLFLFGRSGDDEETPPQPQETEAAAPESEPAPEDPPPMPELAEQPGDTPASPLEALRNAGIGASERDPARLVEEIGKALEARDFEKAGELIGTSALDAETRARLAALAEAGVLRLRPDDSAGEVGELELNRRTRWALHLADGEPGRDRIFFDLAKEDGAWRVDGLVLPPAPGDTPPKAAHADALGIADAFLQATLRQDFRTAREFVDPAAISDAKIAGLCILFEEGDYRLRREKPLRAMFHREQDAGFLAHVLAGDGSERARFSLVLHRESVEADWRVTEINLERLLADYARRFAGGDVHYTPLIKNPKGGDTLVLYFGFDAAGLSPRTRRQLRIVADLLRADPGKTLTISGHTDALGTERYNRDLSARRAASVKTFLVEAGVAESQIVTQARGQSAPRRPNFTPAGEDNPQGRRANRRSEIYLDF